MLVEKQKLICLRATGHKVIVPGTRFDFVCGTCGEYVGIAPSGQKVIAARPDTEIVCSECFHPSDGDVAHLAPGVIDEIQRGGFKKMSES